jgi:hypothetical protein
MRKEQVRQLKENHSLNEQFLTEDLSDFNRSDTAMKANKYSNNFNK